MCNLYSLTKAQAAIRRLFAIQHDRMGNLPPLPGIYPDYPAPVIRYVEGERELLAMRWGMPCPPQYGGRPVTNIRNTGSSHWRAWLKPENRVLVPVTSFCEWTDTAPKRKVWFGLNESEPLFAFAGISCTWRGVRGTKASPVEGDHLLFGFLTAAANGIVAPIHAKAMPVILTGEAEWERWLTAPSPEALEMQRPASDDVLQIVSEPQSEPAEPALL